MTRLLLAALAAAGLAVPAMAQPLPGDINPVTGARPGNEIGTGNSLPTSSNASNIGPGDTQSPIAPRLPSPLGGADATTRQFLLAARAAIVADQTGEAQEALERAETRLLDRDVAPSQVSDPLTGPVITAVTNARRALGAGDTVGALAAINQALGGQ